jgi:tripartite-type tricarboxylate transporter receptor subunit TctC
MTFTHRCARLGAGLATLALTTAPLLPALANAQATDDKPALKIVVPFAAGTPTDTIARALGQALTRSLSRPVVVDNRPGAAGGIGTEYVAQAPADGQTLLLTVNSTVTINPLLYSKLKYDPMKDLAPVALVASGGYLLVANPGTGLRDVAGLVKAAQQRPGVINYASYGPGSMSHMCAEVFQAMAGVKLYHVPYKAGSLNDILGGQVELGFEPVGPTIAHVQNGRLAGLASTTEGRLDALPGVPAMAESLRGYDCTAWVGVLAPVRTPAAVRKGLADALLAIARTPEFARQMKDIGLAAQPADADSFAQVVRRDHERWAQVVRPLRIKLD